MTVTWVHPQREARALESTAPLLFAGDGNEPRRRRVADAVLLGTAVTALVLAALVTKEVDG
ncbi:MAG TPA: hypothetical protein VIX41_07025, partial [Acidimicrobiales bacterium]